MIRDLRELRERAARGGPRVLAVADATGEPTLRAIAAATARGIARATLVGGAADIRRGLSAVGLGEKDFEIVDRPEPALAARAAVALVRSGAADVLMKGALETKLLLRAVLEREAGLRVGRLLSDVFLFPFSAGGATRLVGITDGGVTPQPSLEDKARILVNAVETFHALGCAEPRVAVLSAVERPSARFPASEEALELKRMWRRGEFPPCIVDGPLAMDLALSEEAARLKGVNSPVSGRADILLLPNLEAANIVAKAVEYTVPLEPAHVVVGGSAPVLIPSRAESAEARLNAIALGCWMARARDA